MLVPKNHEKIQIISGLISGGIDEAERRGAKYYDDSVAEFAATAIRDCMPELVTMQNSRIEIEASKGVSATDEDIRIFDGLFVEALLKRISIQKLISIETIEDEEFTISNYDLFAVVVPRYVDPDPIDIAFGSELYVPFGAVEKFEPAKDD